MSRRRDRGRRPAFTLVELLVVIAIIAVLVGLLVPAVQKVREAANRSRCMSNIRQLNIASLNFESSYKGLPRAGEHIVTWTDGVTYKTQDLQSPFTLILPFIEKDDLYQKYDMRRAYNDPASALNQSVAQQVIPIFYCPTNRLSGDRPGANGRDSLGYGSTDYTTCPYIQLDANGAATSTLWHTALTGSPYPANFYQKYSGESAEVSSSKTLQLDNAANFGRIDALYGLPKIAQITDGTSNSLTFYEDVGRNENMRGGSGEYYDPVTNEGRRWWRWAEPDTTSGVSRKVNNNPGATYTTTDPNSTDNCTWRNHDCGPNNEIFSFHAGGAHAAFADGHVTFLRDTLSVSILRAMCTRADSISEAAVEGID